MNNEQISHYVKEISRIAHEKSRDPKVLKRGYQLKKQTSYIPPEKLYRPFDI
ncbi:MAG: hypothetical protein J7K26_01430 [Candidatus Aenigmarchaeota archaeon]|nr:hypothetical protein [Candidatus Aenigmarchaeota archaeon]